MGLLHSPVKHSSVWAKTSSCSTEHHLHSIVVTNTVSNLHGRRNLKKIEMQLSPVKFSQDNEDSIPTLAEQKLKSIYSDPKLQSLSFLSHLFGGTTCSRVLTSVAGGVLATTLSIRNSILILQSDKCGWNMTCFTASSRTSTWKASTVIPECTFVWRPVAWSYANDMEDTCWTM